jgi:hypothetical protein
MKRSSLGKAMAWLACAGMVLSSSRLEAAEPATQSSINQSTIVGEPIIEDVALGAGQTLKGVVVTEEGQPAAKVAVTVRQGEQQIATATTDEAGKFTIAGMRGGVHQINAGRATAAYRLWAPQTAPPHAMESAKLVEHVTVRGQRPFREFFNDGVIILGVIVAAAIAIPIAVHNSGDSGGSGS